MKVTFRHGIAAYSGKNSATGMIYCYYSKKRECIVRQPGKFTPTPTTERMGRIAKHISLLFEQISDGFKSDLQKYAHYSKGMSNSFAIFTKLMWGLHKMYPEIDLEQATMQDIWEEQYPIQTISEAMESGILKPLRIKFQNAAI